MFKNIILYKKYMDFINFDEIECKLAFLFTVVIILIFIRLNVYGNLELYIECFSNITIYIAAAMVTLIGTILTGIALMLSIMDEKFENMVNYTTKRDSIKEIMVSFEFLVFNLGIATVLFFSIHFFLYSNISLSVNKFYILSGIVIYYFIFLIFYTIALIHNSIELYFIKNSSCKFIKDEKMERRVNEVVINLLVSKIYPDKQEEFMNDIINLVKTMNFKNEKELVEYIKKKYQ